MTTMLPSLPDIATTATVPRVPTTLRETGLSADMVEQLLVKTLFGAEATGLVIADRMRLPFPILEPTIERVRAELLVEVRGSTGGGSAGYRYALTDLGRDRALQFLNVNRSTIHTHDSLGVTFQKSERMFIHWGDCAMSFTESLPI